MSQDDSSQEESVFLEIAAETETLLEEIFLSGFHSARKSTVSKIDEVKKMYEAYGMREGAALLQTLRDQMIRRQESFSTGASQVMQAYGRMEFYLEYLKSRCL